MQIGLRFDRVSLITKFRSAVFGDNVGLYLGLSVGSVLTSPNRRTDKKTDTAN